MEQLNIFSEVVCDYKSSLVKIFNPVSSDDELKDNMIFICEDSQLHNYQIKSKNLSLICLTETCEDNENNKFYCPKDDLELINIYINLIDYKKIKINSDQIKRVLNDVFSKYRKAALQVLEKVPSAIANGDENSSELISYNKLLKIEECLFLINERDEQVAIVKKFFQEEFNCSNIALLNEFEFIKKIEKEKQYYFLPINNEYLFFNSSSIETPDHLICFSLVWISYFFSRNITSKKSKINSSLMNDAFDQIHYPMVLITKEGDLFGHNIAFSKLNIYLKECLELKDGSQYDDNGNLFNVQVKSIIHEKLNYNLYIFSDVYLSESQKTIPELSSNHLGIITSSIAHEINNPLGGIIAAITCLQLEDEVNSLFNSELSEISNAAQKCKELVKIFLGFSKALPQDNLDNIDRTVSYALDLLRSRMIESNVLFDFTYELKSKGQKLLVNSSVFTMVFYLIFNEILSSFYKYLLIAEKEIAKSTFVSMRCFEYDNNIEIVIESDLSLLKNAQKIKLVDYLLKMEDFDILFNKNSIKIKKGKS
ncbi:MAG: hypothetical protein HOJ35_10745 [Bdellovibrionales bacterium]|nr:hypothetical protein [Bdellovibrionales bacterium]